MATNQPPTSKITPELKKRVEDAAREFKFTKEDTEDIDKAVQVVLPDSADDTNIRVAASIHKYKFTYEEIKAVLEILREQNSSSTEDISIKAKIEINCTIV